MPRPIPTTVMHFTRVEHLASILDQGLLSDTASRAADATQIEIGHPDIKARRRERRVPIEPGGVVGDYVPFYFASRSPMLYVIDRGNVPDYRAGCARIVYLVTTLDLLVEEGLDVLVTDRNAVKTYATFARFTGEDLPQVDWPLMRQRDWFDTRESPDRKERRMAEALVHRIVAGDLITEVATRTGDVAAEARATIADAGMATPVSVRPEWYF